MEVNDSEILLNLGIITIREYSTFYIVTVTQVFFSKVNILRQFHDKFSTKVREIWFCLFVTILE